MEETRKAMWKKDLVDVDESIEKTNVKESVDKDFEADVVSGFCRGSSGSTYLSKTPLPNEARFG